MKRYWYFSYFAEDGISVRAAWDVILQDGIEFDIADALKCLERAGVKGAVINSWHHISEEQYDKLIKSIGV